MKKLAVCLCLILMVSCLLSPISASQDLGKAIPETSERSLSENLTEPKPMDGTEGPELFETPFLFYALPCPQDILEKAKQDYRAGMNLIGSGNRLSLGTPFTIGGKRDVAAWLFPLISDGKFVGTFRIAKTPDGQFVGGTSPFLGEELNALKEKTKPGEIVLLYFLNNQLIAKVGESKEVLTTFPDQSRTDEVEESVLAETLNQSLIVISAGKEIAGQTVGEVAEPNDNYTGSSARLDFKITETQSPTQSWCAAYATAAIIRYKTGSTTTPTASGLMAMTHRRFTDATTFTNDNIFAVASAYGYSPISTGVVGSTTVFTQIYNKRPLYLGMWRNSAGGVLRHCVVLIGYNKNDNLYEVWNPWYSFTERTLQIGGTSYLADNFDLYIWDKTIYNW